jgi:hypothetical protein
MLAPHRGQGVFGSRLPRPSSGVGIAPSCLVRSWPLLRLRGGHAGRESSRLLLPLAAALADVIAAMASLERAAMEELCPDARHRGEDRRYATPPGPGGVGIAHGRAPFRAGLVHRPDLLTSPSARISLAAIGGFLWAQN